jgi:hypothetical protein
MVYITKVIWGLQMHQFGAKLPLWGNFMIFEVLSKIKFASPHKNQHGD